MYSTVKIIKKINKKEKRVIEEEKQRSISYNKWTEKKK